jgi:hypothetical protein
MWNLGKFTVVIGAVWLVASFALLVPIGPSSGAVAAAATPSSAASAGCHPLSDAGTCYQPGEFCRTTDHGISGVAGDGKVITCEDNDGWRWEPQAGSATPINTATTASTPTGVSTEATASASPSATTSASAIPSATTSAPAGAPATGGGTGPGTGATLAAVGCALIAVGAGFVLFSRRRSRRMPETDRNA